ncbi:MAG: DUF1549 and DUF1553 domain-containing protein [Chthonomonadales bacterium]
MLQVRQSKWIGFGMALTGFALALAGLISTVPAANANPANRNGMDLYFEKFIPKRLNNCNTCHLPISGDKKPDSLSNFPHNAFGKRLADLGTMLRKANKKSDITTRLQMVLKEDADGDGIDNLSEILLGHNPGEAGDKPTKEELLKLPALNASFAKYLASYRWRPFETVQRPTLPAPKDKSWGGNPIDAFLQSEREKRGLLPRPVASKTTLCRRVYLDITGLAPTPPELIAFERDTSPNAYANLVDKLLATPQYGERWGRHWMDIWRYSDWAGWNDGGQIRDSKPFIWRWRDWIVESLNKDKSYDRMVTEMLAADELCPEDPDALRATGFLVRNYKLLSREQWLEDTMNHTSKAFLGVTMHCAKCHNHMYDPVTQEEYYRMRAVFEPHNIRTDRIPGQPDNTKDGLVRTYDAEIKAPTYLFIRGDERNPDKSRALEPGLPSVFGAAFEPKPVTLPRLAYQPDKRDFVIAESIAAAEKALQDAQKSLDSATLAKKDEAGIKLKIARYHLGSLKTLVLVEQIEDAGKKASPEWDATASSAMAAQRETAVAEAELALLLANQGLVAAKDAKESAKKAEAVKAAETAVTKAQTAFTAADKLAKGHASTAYKPRSENVFPTESTGRRLAFANWLTDKKNPLTARVAVNYIWSRHFGEGIVPSVEDFGRNGRKPTNPQLLDWLASEFMANGWSMKKLHRTILMSRTYQMSSTSDAKDNQIDPDNTYLWRMSSRRMEAEIVRDNVMAASGMLDLTLGGPDIDQNLALTSHRRSIYLRHAAEKQAEFIQVFDGPSVTECYERKQTVMPQQALALANSQLVIQNARHLAETLSRDAGGDSAHFVQSAFLKVLARRPSAEELRVCIQFLTDQSTTPISGAKTVALSTGGKDSSTANPMLRARENLTMALFNHNDFVTIR